MDPTPARVTESAPELPCSKSPSNLPGEVALPAGGYCVKEAKATPGPLPSITPSAETIGYVRAETRWLAAQPVEYFIGFSLGAHGKVIGRVDRTDAMPKACTIDIPGVIRESRGQGASGLLVFHNHPRRHAYREALGRHEAGAIEPSAEDISFTRMLRQALREAGMTLVDHVIVGPRAFGYSFAERGEY
jgi:hypothetical protein